jgi:hypothetical protein
MGSGHFGAPEQGGACIVDDSPRLSVRIPAMELPSWCHPVDSDAKCNPVDSIGASTKSRVSHSERRPSARFPGDEDGSATRNIEPLQ